LFFFSVDGFILMFLLEQKIRLFWKIVERARTPKEISLSSRETTLLCFNTNFCTVKEALAAAVSSWHFYWLSVHESIKNKKTLS